MENGKNIYLSAPVVNILDKYKNDYKSQGINLSYSEVLRSLLERKQKSISVLNEVK